MHNSNSSIKVGKIIEEFNSTVEDKDGIHQILLLRVRNNLILQLNGRINNYTAVNFLEKLQPLIGSKKIDRFIVDLSKCQMVTSSIIGFAAFFMMQMKNAGGQNFVIHPNETVVKILRVLKLDAMYELKDKVEDIIGELQG